MTGSLDVLARAQAQQEVLLSLAGSPAARLGDVDGLCRRLTEQVAERLDMDRVGVWLCDGATKQCVCQDIYSRASGLHARGAILQAHAPLAGPVPMLCADVWDGDEPMGRITFERQGGALDWS